MPVKFLSAPVNKTVRRFQLGIAITFANTLAGFYGKSTSLLWPVRLALDLQIFMSSWWKYPGLRHSVQSFFYFRSGNPAQILCDIRVREEIQVVCAAPAKISLISLVPWQRPNTFAASPFNC